MGMAALSRTRLIAAAGFRWSPFLGFSVIRSHYTSGHHITRSSLIPNRTTLGGHRAAMLRSVNSKPTPPSSSPWLMLPPTFDDSGKNMVYQFYSLADDRVVSLDKKKKKKGSEEEVPDDESAVVGSSHGWLALFDWENIDLFLSNPISGRHIKLPPIHKVQPDVPQEDSDVYVNKVVISRSNPYNEDCRAIMSFGPTDELAFCCPATSTDWSLLPGSASSSYTALAYSTKSKLFLCGCRPDIIEAWDLRDPLSPTMTPISKKIPRKKVSSLSEIELVLKSYLAACSDFQFLVVKEGSEDQLFHVKQYVLDRVGPDGSYVDHVYYGPRGESGRYDLSVPYKTVGFDVHRYDPETRSLVYMDGNLGGLALFVGSVDGGFALSPDDFPELKPNSIYYTDTSAGPEFHDQPYSGYDLGIFDYENATFSSCYYPCDLKSMFSKIEPIPRWFTPSG